MQGKKKFRIISSLTNYTKEAFPNMTLFVNSYFAETMVCNHLSKGNVMAIFGPQDDYIAEHIKSITDMVEVPFIDTRYI